RAFPPVRRRHLRSARARCSSLTVPSLLFGHGHAMPHASGANEINHGAGQNPISLLARCAKIVGGSSAERLDLFTLRAGETEGIDLIVLQFGDQLVGFLCAWERPGDEAMSLPPLGDMRRG